MKVTLCQVYLGRIALQTAITTITTPVTVPACDAASNAYSSCKNLYRAISSHVSPTKKTRNSMHNSFNTKDSFLRSSMISAKCLSYHFVHINLKADWNAIQNKPFYWQEGKRLLACSTYYHTNSYNDCLSPRSEQIRLCFCFTIPKFPRQTARLEGLGF